MNEKKCPKCGGAMEGGKLAGFGYLIFLRDDIKGMPLFSKDKTVLTKALMCANCGYLELFAELKK